MSLQITYIYIYIYIYTQYIYNNSYGFNLFMAFIGETEIAQVSRKNIFICVFQDIEDPDTQGCSLWLIYESSWETYWIFFRISKCYVFVKLVSEVDIPSLKLILNTYLQCLSINVHNNDDWFLKVNPTNLHFFSLPLTLTIKTLDITS